jgi:hypothetical protein
MESMKLSENELRNLRAGMELEFMELVGFLDKTDGSLFEMEKILEPGFKETKRVLLEKSANLKAKTSSKKKL